MCDSVVVRCIIQLLQSPFIYITSADLLQQKMPLVLGRQMICEQASAGGVEEIAQLKSLYISK